MRFVAWLLIVVSLVLAIVSAVTAYSPKLSLPDSQLAGLTLNAPAGLEQTPDGERPIATKGMTLTAELLAKLRAAREKRVRVKEFSFRGWSEWWLFVVGCVGMLAGAVIVRRENARQLALGHADAKTGAGPDAVLHTIRTQLDALRQRLSRTSEATELHFLVLESVGQMIAEQIPSFIAARPVLVSRLGLAGYAQLMDHFAAGERQLNRAWSAAADGYDEEAVECLTNAAVLLEEAEQKMR